MNRVLPQRFLAKGMWVKRLFVAFAACLALLFVAMPTSVNAAETEGANGTATGASGLPVPRFVSLKPARVNLRIGPGRDYPVSWLFMKSGLPVEIIQEYDNWRRIRDADGTEGWVYQSLLSGKRTAITAPWLKNDKSKMITMRRDANDTAAVAADIEPGVVGTVRQCTGQWCRMDVSGVRGWIRQSDLWGVYPGEVFD
ncbi:SH3-like domain-containing protein [Ochrobactrum sp. 19YEA23]|nr:SH3-like domain-containing protein [Ochrobactrum sp. 19YEA23]